MGAAERLNFTQAAERLNLTQPAVTLQVKHLEADLGVRLFDRTSTGLRLTPAGELLLDYARRIDALYTEAQSPIAGRSTEVRGHCLWEFRRRFRSICCQRFWPDSDRRILA